MTIQELAREYGAALARAEFEKQAAQQLAAASSPNPSKEKVASLLAQLKK